MPGRITDALGGAFSKQELQALGRLGTLIQVPTGKDLIVEGGIGGESFVVVAGTADVIREDEVVASIGAGSVFGETALPNSVPLGASVSATTALSVFVLSPAEFLSLRNECPRLDKSVRDLDASRQAQ